MKKGDLVKRHPTPYRSVRPELGIIVGFEEGPLQDPYVRWFTNPHGPYVSLEDRSIMEVVNEKR